MKQIVIKGKYDVQLQEIPIPEPETEMLLVKTNLTGISAGTEMMLYRGTHPNLTEKKRRKWSEYPIVPGYELVGTVVAVGAPADFSAGERKTVSSIDGASPVIMTRAEEFRIGDRVVCLGEHGEYASVPATMAAKLPEQLSDEEATLAVLSTTAMHCIHRAQIQYGDTVAVIGMGVLGFLTLQHARNAGAGCVIAIERNRERLQYAKQAGADLCIDPDSENAVEIVREITGGMLADVVIEASGAAGTEGLACDLARVRGKVVILGWHTKHLDIHFGDMFSKELTLMTSNAIGPEPGLPYSRVRWTSDQSLKRSVDLLAQSRIRQIFKPSKFHYTDIRQVYDRIDKNYPELGMQVLLTWEKR